MWEKTDGQIIYIKQPMLMTLNLDEQSSEMHLVRVVNEMIEQFDITTPDQKYKD